MSTHKIIGVTVVRTQHHHVRALGYQLIQCLIILGGTTLAYNHLHTRIYAGMPLVQRRALVVGANTRIGILLALATGQSWCMPVHRFTMASRCIYLLHHLLIACQHTRIVHHLRQKADILTGHQRLDILRIYHSTTRFNVATYGRHTTGRTEQEVEPRLLS